MRERISDKQLPDLNYYTDKEPWRENCRLAHEVIRLIGAQHTSRPSRHSQERASATWLSGDHVITLFERQRDNHADYTLALATNPYYSGQPRSTTERFWFSSKHPRIRHAPEGADLHDISDDAYDEHRDTIRTVCLSGLSYAEPQDVDRILDQMRTDSRFWEQAAHMTLYTAEFAYEASSEAGEAIYHATPIPALRHLARKALADPQASHEASAASLARAITDMPLAPLRPDFPAHRLTVRDSRLIQRHIQDHLNSERGEI